MTPPETPKLRIAFLGDSITLGDGDVEARGWPSRFLAVAVVPPRRAQCYNLGVGGEGLHDLGRRWRGETHARLAGRTGCGVMIMIGVNDALRATRTHSAIALDIGAWQAALTSLVSQLQDHVPVCLIGPAPVHDALRRDDGARGTAVNDLLTRLEDAVQATARTRNTPFVAMGPLRLDEGFQSALKASDMLHPVGHGHEIIAQRLVQDRRVAAFLTDCAGVCVASDAWLDQPRQQASDDT